MTTLTITAIGTPAPAGSKRAFVVNGRARMTESSSKVRPWWQAVAGAAQDALPDQWETHTGPVKVEILFLLARPRYHYRTGARANELKPAAPSYVDKKPDTDKLERTVLDALKAVGVYRDDCLVAELHAVKRYADGPTGARITITPLDGEPTVSAAPVTQEPQANTGAADTTEQGVLL